MTKIKICYKGSFSRFQKKKVLLPHEQNGARRGRTSFNVVKNFPKMKLYAVTLQRATAITTAAIGNFSGTKQQEIAVSRGKLLELLRPDDSGKMQSLVSTECFGLVRSIVPFRLTGTDCPPSRFFVQNLPMLRRVKQRFHCNWVGFGKNCCLGVQPSAKLF